MTERKRNAPLITARSRTLRGNMTDVERILWHALREKQVNGFRFRRQHPIGKYITDFACIERKLAIELDGGQHHGSHEYDEQRTEFLNKQGWQVLRFWNNNVIDNLGGVLTAIAKALEGAPPP